MIPQLFHPDELRAQTLAGFGGVGGGISLRRAGVDAAVRPHRAVSGKQHAAAPGGPGKRLADLRQPGIYDLAHVSGSRGG